MLRTGGRNRRGNTKADGDSGRIITNAATSLLDEITSLRIVWENKDAFLSQIKYTTLGYLDAAVQ